jgi:F1F0 ATPase subunit 2
MSDAVVWSGMVAGGFVLGILFFGGLWLTVQKSVASKKPWLWFLTSMVLRTSLTLGGFYLLANGNWQRLLLSLGGFLAARVFIFRVTERKSRKETDSCI